MNSPGLSSPQLRWFVCSILFGLATTISRGQDKKEYPNPERFESAIRQFEKQDAASPAPANAIVCVGSSSMLKWHKNIHEDLAPLTVIARGFGGSNMNDLLHFLHRVVLVYKPRAVVIYEGDNDIGIGITPVKITETFNRVVAKIHAALPKTRIYFLAIKPSGKRWQLWPEMQKANHLIADRCAADPLLTFVDVATPMLDANGQVKKDIFVEDNLHMNRAGYKIWRAVLRPILMKNEARFEKQPAIK